ncbi:Intradiol ring-cleavage dioxygenase [Macrophomina phaseolina MS6]|uniref:Intradiol ring-cleavage dioxygenase n=2 Tax=Macrophomina phaseolina TaxID=35725 RepID=K2RQ89_MACPH|nr:Intradiol ring-cleavage dioxygenase [Macrophomina phaseolina MS6]KAH7055974.1 Intradiol ring-cleavage dioxygenase [Macrophomina phaseolina]
MAMSSEKFDPKFTENVINAIGPACPPRARFVLSAMLKHIHDFAREVELTTEEWMAGVEFMNQCGKLWTESNGKRNETHRITDIIGLESLVDEIANKHLSATGEAPTSSTILGPFWSPDAPFRENGGSIIDCPHNGEVALMHGKVIDLETKKPIPNVVFDIWQASSNGKYDFQDPEGQTPNNLRGKFRTNENGEYHFYMLRPTAYALPTDGPAGVLLRLMDRSPWRPAHIHLMVSHPDYKPVVTQLYPDTDPHLIDDSVFAVKDDLIIHFNPREGDPKAKLDLEYNVRLAPKDAAGKTSSQL